MEFESKALESIVGMGMSLGGAALCAGFVYYAMIYPLKRFEKWYKKHKFKKDIEAGKPPFEDGQLYFKFMTKVKYR